MRSVRVSSALCVPLLGILANAAGGLLYRAEGPDSLQSFASLAGAFFLFLSYLFSQLSWGALVERLLGKRFTWTERFFLGSASLTLLLSVLGLFPLVGRESRPFWNLVLVSGCAVALLFSRKPAEKGFPLHWIDGVAALVFALGLIGTFSPHPFFDSLWYHLTASRLWFLEGSIHLPEVFPVAFKTGIWDMHFLLGQILLGGEEGGGLITAQLFGQWAGFSCLVASYALLRQLPGFSPFAALAGVLGTELFLVAEFAKNDWAAVFYSLAAFSFLQRAPLLAGAAAGLAFASKFTAAFFLVPLLLFLAWERRRDPFLVAGAAGLFLLLAAPLLLRNLYFTGNPLFPAMGGLFPSMMGPTWENIAVFERPVFTLAAFGEKLRFFALDSKAVLGLLFLPLVWRSFGKRWLGFAALSSLLFFLFTGPKAEWRLAGAALLLLGAYGALILERVGERLLGKRALWLLVPALLVFAPLSFHFPRENPALKIRAFVAGGALAWVRLHGEEGSLAATLNEQRIYYLFPRPPIRAFDIPELDRALHSASSQEEMVEVFRKRKVRYLVLSAEFLDLYYDRRIVDLAYRLSERHPEAVVYRAELSRVLDLQLLP